VDEREVEFSPENKETRNTEKNVVFVDLFFFSPFDFIPRFCLPATKNKNKEKM
jgi:hypothetical protein